MKLDQRRMNILTSLSHLEILTRSQIQLLHNTKSVRNTNFIMQSLKPYTSSIRLHENAYYLNKKGAALVGMENPLQPNNQIQHRIMRNDAYIYFNPTGWISERKFEKPVAITADAYFKYNDKYHFLEVDHTQGWQKNIDKMERYKQFKDSGVFQKDMGYFPDIVWVIKYESRKEKLVELARKMRLICKVFLHEEIIP